MSIQPLVTDDLATALGATLETLKTASDGEVGPDSSSDTCLVYNMLTEARVRQFAFQVDEPPLLGGTDQAPNPVGVHNVVEVIRQQT